MTTITTQSDLVTWASTGGTGTLINDITLSGGTFPLSLADNCVLDGGRFTITVESTLDDGLFEINTNNYTATISNLIIDADAIDKSNNIMFNYPTSSISGITINITNCGIIGDFIMRNNGGPYIGNTNLSSTSTYNITGCFSTATLSTGWAGGIIGHSGGSGSDTMIISNCYHTGVISGSSCGGITARSFGNTNTTPGNAIIQNCYSTGIISGSNSGGITGTGAGSNLGYVTISNCYSFGDITGTDAGGIYGENIRGDNVTIANCYAKHATGEGPGTNTFGTTEFTHPTVTNSGYGSGSWTASLGTDLLDNGTWTNASGFASGFGLVTFTTSPWDSVSYTSNNSTAAYAEIVAEGSGDPHITTMHGISYNLISNKYFRLFDNDDPTDKLTINCSLVASKHPIWKGKEYIDEILITYKGKECLLKPGFRGEYAKIISNNIDSAVVQSSTLPTRADCKKFCGDCKYRTRNNNLLMRHRRAHKHNLLLVIRNEITINIKTKNDEFDVIVSNVNDDNFEPSKITIKPKTNKNINRYKGASITQSQPYAHDIPLLTHII